MPCTNKEFKELPRFLQGSVRQIVDIVTDTFVPQTAVTIFKNTSVHMYEFANELHKFANSLETSDTWIPSDGAKQWESELKKCPKLERTYMNMIDLTMESADSQDTVLKWLITAVALFQSLSTARWLVLN
jgi:hypothetical protein